MMKNICESIKILGFVVKTIVINNIFYLLATEMNQLINMKPIK